MFPMMDSREAIRCLDAYTDSLISLTLLVEADMFQNRSDQETSDIRNGLKIKLAEKQQEAMALALAITTAKDRRHAEAGSLVDIFGINAAVQRYILADNQACAALASPKESFATGMAKIHAMVAAREISGKEIKPEAGAEEAVKNNQTGEDIAPDPVSTATVHDATAGNP